jgi:hypothetical protein
MNREDKLQNLVNQIMEAYTENCVTTLEQFNIDATIIPQQEINNKDYLLVQKAIKTHLRKVIFTHEK